MTPTPTSGAAALPEALRLHALTAQDPSQTGGFSAGDMASAAAQGYRDGWTAAQTVAEPGTAYAAALDTLFGAIMGAAYDFRDAHLSGSGNIKRHAHAELESTVRSALAASHGQAPAGATLGSDAIYELIHGFGHTTHAQSMEIALGIADLSPPSTTTQPVSQQEAQEPHGWLYEWTHSSATGRPDTTYTAFTTDEAHARKHDNCRAIYTSPQPSPAAQGDALVTAAPAGVDEPAGRTDAQMQKALMAYLQCTASELENYSLKLMDGYTADVQRILAAITPAPVGVEPYGRITTHSVTGQQFFYRWPESPYLDNASECVSVYTTPQPTHAQTGAVPLTAKQMESGREAIFSTGNPYCPCDSKTFRKVAEWVERHHDIKGGKHGADT